MSAAVHGQVASATEATGTFGQIKEGTLRAVNWMGKQIQWLGTTIKEYMIKVIEWAKPFFQKIGKLFVEMYDRAREFIINNREASVAVAVAVPVIAALALGSYHLLSGESVPPEGTTGKGTQVTK